MANISFDEHRHAYITIDNIGNDISFLMCPVFDNSELNLLRDIQLCDNQDLKKILVCFYEFIKASNREDGDDNDIVEDEISLEFESGDSGDWCAVVHNIKAEHSGYWYAAQNLEAEKCCLIRLRHELEGIKIAVENLESVISSIRNAVSKDDAMGKMIELGIDEQQAKAIMRMNITRLVSHESSYIPSVIAQCNRWAEFIEKIMKNNIQIIKNLATEISNPWVDIAWEQPYAKCDKDIILSPLYIDKLQIDGTLPEPFTGNIKSNVVFLNGNPGNMDTNCEDQEVFLNETKDTLCHSTDHFMWFSDKLRKTKHSGCGWWKDMTKELRMALGNEMPQLFVLEFFPYHSAKMFNFPALPSDAYRNYLLRKAIDDKKLIVIMRAETRWYSIIEDDLGKRLKNYKNKIVLRNPQRVYLTKNNMGEANWKNVIEALGKDPIE